MRLLVSVATPAEGATAVAGGADIVDAKDPRRGALGAVTLPAFLSIHAAVAGATPVSAALGEADDDATVERDARAFAKAGASFVKIGFAGVRDVSRVAALIAAALRATPHVVAVAYADAEAAGTIGPLGVIEAAARAGAHGVLIDTADKRGPGLCARAQPGEVAAWVAYAHRERLRAALAGKLSAGDLAALRDAGADIIGVRGAACEGGRTGVVAEHKVRALRDAVRTSMTYGGSGLQTRPALTRYPRP